MMAGLRLIPTATSAARSGRRGALRNPMRARAGQRQPASASLAREASVNPSMTRKIRSIGAPKRVSTTRSGSTLAAFGQALQERFGDQSVAARIGMEAVGAEQVASVA